MTLDRKRMKMVTMSETMDVQQAQLQTETSQWRFQRASMLAVPLVCLSLTGCLSSGSNKDVAASGSARPSVLSSSPVAGPSPTETLPEAATPSVRPAPQSPEATASATPDVAAAVTAPASTGAEGIASCRPYFDVSRYRNHEYEACTAYVVNASEIALQGFYKFGNNRIGYLSGAARHHFATRYWAGARQTIESRVDAWPKAANLTGNRVEMAVTVLSLSSNLKQDRALLQTQESAMVTDKSGRLVYNQALQTKAATICRGTLPGHPLHEWFVVSSSRQPNFDCLGFDRANGLKP